METTYPTNQDAASLRGDCIEAIKLHGDMTADECATRLGRSVLAIRPRFTEMQKRGWIFKSGTRRKNSSGLYATVWTIDPQARLF